MAIVKELLAPNSLVEREEGVASEILLASMDAGRDNSQKLPLEVLANGKAFMRGQDADVVNFACLHKDSIAVWILIGYVSDITIERCIFVFRVPYCAAVVQIVGEENSDVSVEGNVISAAPCTSPAENLLVRTPSCFRMDGSPIFRTLASVWLPRDGKRFVDREETDVAPFQKHRFDDFLVGCVGLRNRC